MKKTKKRVFKGWTYGKAKTFPIRWCDNMLLSYDVHEKRGKIKDWDTLDWPPKRVTITVEVEND